MSAIADKRCFNHGGREAVARCPRCERYYCRECITEHEGRVICGRCLASRPEPGKRGHLAALAGAGFPALGGVLLLWLVFYYLGKALLLVPTSFHEGTFWK